jgi:CCR4-NOT transcription complex subunit 9
MQVATFIVQKIILDDTGLHYVCATSERYFAVVSVLALMVESAERPSASLLKCIICCYLRLTHDARFVLCNFDSVELFSQVA